MLPGRACGIDFNITEIKITLFWNICKTPWFHTGISHSCLPVPKLNTFHKTELGVEELGDVFFIILIRILINIFGDIHLHQSRGTGGAIAGRHRGFCSTTQGHCQCLRLPGQQGLYSNQQGFPKLENERTDLILVQECQVKHANCIWFMSWLSNNEQVTNFYMGMRVKDFIKPFPGCLSHFRKIKAWQYRLTLGALCTHPAAARARFKSPVAQWEINQRDFQQLTSPAQWTYRNSHSPASGPALSGEAQTPWGKTMIQQGKYTSWHTDMYYF